MVQQNVGELACLFEATEGGNAPIRLDGGGILTYLEDGDEVVISAWCGGNSDGKGAKGFGFGECRGKILASQWPEL